MPSPGAPARHLEASRRLLDRITVSLAGLFALVAAVAWSLGGFSAHLGALTLSVRQPTRPLALAFALLLLREAIAAAPGRRSCLRFALLYAGILLALAGGSRTRLVGDGQEYAAMALNLAEGRAPALLKEERDEAERALSLAPGELAEGRGRLLGSDGRQDFHHFWLYPLLASPAVAAARAAGMSPLVGFTAVNVILLLLTAAVLHPRTGVAGALIVLGGPLLWWLDKAHPEVFLVSLVACALALLPERPGLAVVLLGLAAAQNPVFALALGAATLWIVLRGRAVAPGVWPGLAAAVSLTLTNPLYCLARLGRAVPLGDTVLPHLPSVTELGAVVWDPNLGLGPAWPSLVLGAILGLVIALRDRARKDRRVDAGCLLLAVAVLLVAFTQPGNINHGGTRGMSRYALWLAPSALPALAALAGAGRRGHAATVALAVGSLLLVFSDYHPRLPERTFTPTPLAEWLWTKAPALDRPLPEVFAERAWGAPPLGRVPAGMPRCEKALLLGDGNATGSWPLSCAPAEKPEWCQTPGVLCYANAGPSGRTFAIAPRQPTFLDPALRRWYWRGRPSPAVLRRFASFPWEDLAPVAPELEMVLLRERHGIGRVHLRTALGVYLAWLDGPRREGAFVVPWAPEPREAILIDPLTGEELSRTTLAQGASTRVAIPLRAPLLLVVTAGGSTRDGA